MKEIGEELRIRFEFECKGEKELRESVFKFKSSEIKWRKILQNFLAGKEKTRERKLSGNQTQKWWEQDVKKCDGQKCCGK